MATTKIIPEVLDLRGGLPDYSLAATNTVTYLDAGGGNQYNFNGAYGLYGVVNGTYVLSSVSSSHPIAILNNGKTSLISYTGAVNEGSQTGPDGNTYTYYSGDVTITVSGNFDVVSYACKVHGYMGGQNNLIYTNLHSDLGLKIPTGTVLNRPATEVAAMVRNNTSETSESSASCEEYYNGATWQKINNTFPVTSTDIITVTDTQKFDRNQTTPTNNTRYTYSFWVKWSNFGTAGNIFICTGQYPSVAREEIQWDNANTRWFLYYDSGSADQGQWNSPTISAPTDGVWYHYCFQKIAQQAPVLFVNGTSIGTWTSSAAPSPPAGDGTSTRINSGSGQHRINGPQWASTYGMNASLANCQFVDGSIQAPSAFTTTSFGYTVPASYTGTWGDNGWQLLFANTGAIGTDTSGNNNNFTTVPAASTGTDLVYF